MSDDAAPDVSTSDAKSSTGEKNGTTKPTGPGLRPSGAAGSSSDTSSDEKSGPSERDEAAARAFAAGAAAREASGSTPSTGGIPTTGGTPVVKNEKSDRTDSSSRTSEAPAASAATKPAGRPNPGPAPTRSEAPVSTNTSPADLSATRPAAGRPMIQNRPQGGPFVTTDRPAERPERGGWDREPELTTAPAPQPTGRVARLTVSSVELMSVLKVSLMLSVAAGVALVIATSVLWLTLKGVGVFDQLNSVFGSTENGAKASSFDIYDYIGFGRVLSVSVLVGAFNVLLLMSLSVIVALIYNISAGLVGGVRVTLSDE